MNKKILSTITAVVACTSLIFTGCSNKETADTATVTEDNTSSLSESDISSYIAGLSDHYIIKDAADIDYLSGIKIDGAVITDVTVSSDQVDLTSLGSYPLTYTLYVDEDAYASLSSSADNSIVLTDIHILNGDIIIDSQESTEDTSSEEKVIKQLTVEKTVEVVDAETGNTLASQGLLVWESKNKSVGNLEEEIIDETVVEAADENETEDSEDDNSSDSQSADSNQRNQQTTTDNSSSAASDRNNSNNNSNQNTSQNSNSGSSSNTNTDSSNSSSDSDAGHTHNWQAVTETQSTWIVDSESYDEAVYELYYICNDCGAAFGAESGAAAHASENGHSYHAANVQTGTVHHEGTGHYEDTEVITGYVCSECGETR